MAKYLSTLVTYYGTGSVMETLSTDKVTSKQLYLRSFELDM